MGIIVCRWGLGVCWWVGLDRHRWIDCFAWCCGRSLRDWIDLCGGGVHGRDCLQSFWRVDAIYYTPRADTPCGIEVDKLLW